MKVLVTGGAGYIGSTVASCCADSGITPVILDDYSTGLRTFAQRFAHYEGDIADVALLNRVVDEHPDIEAVIHCAAKIVVPESVEKPLYYYDNNVARAISLIDALSSALHRPIRHVWVTHSLGANEPPALREHGYTPAFSEVQATLSLEAVPAPVHAVDVVADMDFAPEDIDSFLRLLASASANFPRGELILDTVDWTHQRLIDAGARLRDRGGTQLTALARSESGDVVGLAEAVTFDHDVESVCELGLVYVLPEHRGRGLGCDLVAAVLCAARERWEDAETAFASYPAGEVAAEALGRRFGAEAVSATTVWQKAKELLRLAVP